MVKRVLIALIAITCLVSCKPKREVFVWQGQARIEFDNDEREYDFKEVSIDKKVLTHDFVFFNSGSEPLVIHDVKTSCGCLEVDYPKEPIKAGEEGVFHVKLDVTQEPRGFIRRSFVAYNNSMNRAEVRIVVEATLND